MRWPLLSSGLIALGVLVAFAVGPPAATAEDQPAKKGKGGAIQVTVKGRPKRHLKKGVLVYIEKIKGKFPPPKKHVVMDQKGMKFLPHILPVLAGTTVDFLNSDPLAHNVFSPDGEKYNLGTWPQGQTRGYTFKQLGVYAQLCHVHPEMEGFVVVLQNPYFALAGEKGSCEIKGVPPGEYTLVAWNSRMKLARQEVTVAAGQVTKAEFALKRK